MPDVLVVNASPLIFLGNAGQIELCRFVPITNLQREGNNILID